MRFGDLHHAAELEHKCFDATCCFESELFHFKPLHNDNFESDKRFIETVAELRLMKSYIAAWAYIQR